MFEHKQKKKSKSNESESELPHQLKTGIESLSGYSMDDVRVHRNSSQPAGMNAHAFAQGRDIHLAPGQEKHLPHEAWHVVQQKQGRVQANQQFKGIKNLNDDAGLEREADVMGEKALRTGGVRTTGPLKQSGVGTAAVQRKIGVEIEVPDLPIFAEETAKKHPQTKNLTSAMTPSIGIFNSNPAEFAEELGEIKYNRWNRNKLIRGLYKIARSERVLKLNDLNVDDEIDVLVNSIQKSSFARVQPIAKTLYAKILGNVRSAGQNSNQATRGEEMDQAIKNKTGKRGDAYGPIGRFGSIRIDADHSRNTGKLVATGKLSRNIMELVMTKPLTTAAEVPAFIAELDRFFAAIQKNTDNLRKPGHIPGTAKGIKTGPAFELSQPMMDMERISGNIQVSLGIPLDKYEAVARLLSVEDNGQPLIQRGKKNDDEIAHDTAHKRAAEDATHVFENLIEKWPENNGGAETDQTAGWNAVEKQALRGLLVLISATMRQMAMKMDTSQMKNKYHLLPKTLWHDMIRTMPGQARSFLVDDTGGDKVRVDTLQRLTGAIMARIPASERPANNDDKRRTPESVEEKILRETGGAREGRSIKPGPLGGAGTETAPVFEFRSIQEHFLPRSSWSDLLLSYVELNRRLMGNQSLTESYGPPADDVQAALLEHNAYRRDLNYK